MLPWQLAQLFSNIANPRWACSTEYQRLLASSAKQPCSKAVVVSRAIRFNFCIGIYSTLTECKKVWVASLFTCVLVAYKV